jgi:hypothetical protein
VKLAHVSALTLLGGIAAGFSLALPLDSRFLLAVEGFVAPGIVFVLAVALGEWLGPLVSAAFGVRP